MKLTEVIEKLGDKNYTIGRPIYFGACMDDEQEYIQVHAQPVLKMGMPNVIDKIIRNKDAGDKGIAIAYGGFIGIDIAAANDSEGVLLVDINPDQKKFWRSLIELIKECPTAKSFNEHFSTLNYRYNLREARSNVSEPYPSFTEDEDVYKKVRKWALEGMMASTDMDVLDSERHHKLAGLLKHNVGMIFLTNIPYFYTGASSKHVGSDSVFKPKTNFYSGAVAYDDYELIFDNQKILGNDNTKIVYCDTCKGHDDFPLKQSTLGDALPMAIVR